MDVHKKITSIILIEYLSKLVFKSNLMKFGSSKIISH